MDSTLAKTKDKLPHKHSWEYVLVTSILKANKQKGQGNVQKSIFILFVFILVENCCSLGLLSIYLSLLNDE